MKYLSNIFQFKWLWLDIIDWLGWKSQRLWVSCGHLLSWVSAFLIYFLYWKFWTPECYKFHTLYDLPPSRPSRFGSLIHWDASCLKRLRCNVVKALRKARLIILGFFLQLGARCFLDWERLFHWLIFSFKI